ncbi:hypothetical protein K7432_003418 [Basidiobolus ranarum]|uniref:Uncharacterized protein n=1 Tax=Basidiobolus ranarum TaxID=34480 RepID=A0ABR2W674_9FUNG
MSKDVSDKNGSQWASTEMQTSNCSDSEVPLGHSNLHISPQSQSTARSEYQTASMLSQKEPQSLPISPHSMKNGTPPIPPSSSSPSLFPPIRDTRSESPHIRLTSSPHNPASPSPAQRPNPPSSHDFTLPPIYEQHPHLPPISMGSMPSNISDPMSYQPSHGYSNPSMNGPVSQPNHQPIRYSPNPQPSSTEYYNSGTPNQHPVHQSPSPRTLPSGEVQGSSGSNITKEDLEAHRMELQREVSHLSILLSKTTAMLAGLDQAVTSKEPSRPDIRAGIPSREQTTSGPPSYWDGSSNGYQPMQQPNPNYRNHYYPPNGGAGYAPTYHNVDEYSKRESSRYPEGLMQSQYYPPQYQNMQPPQQPHYDPRSQPPYHYGNPQLPPLYPSPPPPPPSSDGVNQPSQTIRY